MTLRLTTAGESHGPALVAILSGLPAGLVLDRSAIDADLARRQQGYGRSPRQKLEQDVVEVLAGLRHGRTLGTPLALVVRNRDHANWEWGMSPWPPEGEPAGKGSKPVTLPRPGHADLAGTLKFGHADARDALERASARQTAVSVAAGAVAKALLAGIAIEIEGRVVTQELEARIDEARAERDTVGGVVEVMARGVPPGLGSYASKEERLDARLAAALMGIQAVKGVEIGGGFELAERRGSQAHDEILADEQGALYRETNFAGGIEGGISNGEEVVARAAMKPLPTLMRPLRSVDLETGEAGEALVERSDVAAVEALAVVAEAAVAFELARAAQEKFGGDSFADFVGRLEGVRGAHPVAHALDRHLALIGFMGAGKTTLGTEVAQRLERRFVDLDRELEQTAQASVPELFETLGEEGFRAVEAEQTLAALRHSMPAVLALGGGAVETPAVRRALGEYALTVLIDVDAETAWERADGSDRPLARDEGSFRALHAKRQPLYRKSADAVAGDADEIVLAAGGIHVEEGSLARLGDFLPPGEPRAPGGCNGASGSTGRRSRRRCTRSEAARTRRAWARSSGSGASSGSTATARSSRSAAAARPTPRALRRPPTSAGSAGSRSRPPSSARWTRRSAARPPSTCARART